MQNGIVTSKLHIIIKTQNQLLSHPVYGASWEGFVIENICSAHPDWRPYFFRSGSGAEIDLILTKGRRRVAVECKASSAPQVNRSFFNALKDLEIKEAWVLAPVAGSYPLKGKIFVSALDEFLQTFS